VAYEIVDHFLIAKEEKKPLRLIYINLVYKKIEFD
jgi:hypothetical protein